MENSLSSIVTSLIALGGVLLTSLFAYLANKRKSNVDVIAQKSNEQTELLKALQEEREFHKNEADKFREKYYRDQQTITKLQSEIQNLTQELKLMQKEMAELRAQNQLLLQSRAKG